MRSRLKIALMILIAAAVWAYGRFSSSISTIEYQGIEIKLSKDYSDYDDYKNDPDNIALSETARVQKLVMSAPISKKLTDRLSVFQATQKIAFPGYGSGSGVGTLDNGSEIVAVTIEVPRAERDRYLVFNNAGGTYILIDDFVDQPAHYPFTIRPKANGLLYFSRDGKMNIFRESNSGSE
jgi:hypothetical protein